MIGTIKRFGQVKCTHIDCRTIRDVLFYHLSNGINRIPTAAQMLLETVLVIRGVTFLR